MQHWSKTSLRRLAAEVALHVRLRQEEVSGVCKSCEVGSDGWARELEVTVESLQTYADHVDYPADIALTPCGCVDAGSNVEKWVDKFNMVTE